MSKEKEMEEIEKIEKLRESEEELKAIFNNIRDGIVLLDTTGKIIKVNKRIVEIGGYTEEEIVGKRFKVFKMFTPQSLTKMISGFTKAVISGRSPSPIEVEMYTKTGEKMNLELHGSLFKKRGKVVGFIGTIRDITEQKKAEEKLKKNKEDYQIIFENLPFAAFTLDRKGRLLEANKRAEQVTGLRLKELKGKSFSKFGVLGKKDLLKAFIEFRKNLRGKITKKTIYNVKVKDSREILLELIGIPLKEGGKVTKVLDVGSDVTEREKAEEELRESEERYRLISENTSDMIALTTFSLNPVYTYVSPSAKYLGYEPEDVIGKPCFDFVHPDDKKKLLPLLRKYVSAKVKKLFTRKVPYTTETIEYRFRDKSGNWHYLQSTANLMKNELLFISRDVTERKKMEEALRESEKRYKFLVDNSKEIILILSKIGKIIFANKSAIATIGYNEEEIIGKPITHFLTKGSIKKALYALSQEFLGRPQQEMEIKTKSGEIRTLEVAKGSTPVHEKGKSIGVLINACDITERKKAEEELKASEEKYRTLTENINVGIYRNTVGPKGKFIEANPAIIRMFGYSSKEEFLNINVSNLYQHPEDRERFNQKMLKDGFVKDEELQLKKKDRTPFYGSVTAIAVKDETGKVKYYDGMIEDITERKHLEDLREKARREAEFYADVLAHDIGNLDQITMGYLYLLQMAKDEETKKKNVDGIKKSIMKSKRLAESIKTLKIIKDTKIEKFDLNKSIERSIKNIKEYSDKEIEVKLDMDKHYYVKANVFLDRVFFNILENSVEFTFQDKAIIDIKTEEKKGICNIHIRDRGIGIPKAKKEDILENLETLSKRTGTGLYLVKKILERFDGKFEIKDAEKGTKIIISIPVRQNGGSARNVHPQRSHKRNEREGRR